MYVYLIVIVEEVGKNKFIRMFQLLFIVFGKMYLIYILGLFVNIDIRMDVLEILAVNIRNRMKYDYLWVQIDVVNLYVGFVFIFLFY